LKIATSGTTLQIDVAPFSKFLLRTGHGSYFQHIQVQLLGSWQKEPKTNSTKEQLRKPSQNFKIQISPFVAERLFGDFICLKLWIQNILLWDSIIAAPPIQQ
jgi:hypothetical protein